MREILFPPDGKMPECPVCGEVAKTIVETLNGEVLGCDNCLVIKDAQFWMEERYV